MNFKERLLRRKKTGLTLVELLVVIAIIGIITAVAVGYDARFKKSIAVNNLAYDMALSIRTAQSYGIGIRQTVGVIPDYYYINFNLSENENYSIWSGSSASGEETKVQDFNLTGGLQIMDICLVDLDDNCNQPSGYGLDNYIDIRFERPYPDAFFYGLISEERVGLSDYIKSVKIQVGFSEDLNKCISVWNTGQISVENCE